MCCVSLQLKENIEKFFTWFVEEGKATVRLKEPAIDICLSKVKMCFISVGESCAVTFERRDRVCLFINECVCIIQPVHSAVIIVFL